MWCDVSHTARVHVGAKEVAEVVDAGDGTVYIGGAFTSVNGTATPGRVARIDANTGALVTSFKAPKVNGNVNDMQLINNKLYVGGNFLTMGGQSRTRARRRRQGPERLANCPPAYSPAARRPAVVGAR